MILPLACQLRYPDLFDRFHWVKHNIFARIKDCVSDVKNDLAEMKLEDCGLLNSDSIMTMEKNVYVGIVH